MLNDVQEEPIAEEEESGEDAWQETVLVSVRLIEVDTAFWPDASAIHLLASTWEKVDPLEDDDDEISKLMVDTKAGEMVHFARQPLYQIDFAPEPGGLLQMTMFQVGSEVLFDEDLPTLSRLLRAAGRKEGDETILLLYEVESCQEEEEEEGQGEGEKQEGDGEPRFVVYKELVGYLFLDEAPFNPVSELQQKIAGLN